MNKRILTTLTALACCCALTTGCGTDDNGTDVGSGGTEVVAKAVEKTNAMHVYAHWMPWFETNTSNPLSAGKVGARDHGVAVADHAQMRQRAQRLFDQVGERPLETEGKRQSPQHRDRGRDLQ